MPFERAVAIMAADDDPPPPKSAVPAGAASKAASEPMIIPNRDGTFTIQKEPPDGNSKVTNGLVILPQVVVPIVPPIEKKR
jgi:hypothetical protein